MAFEPLFTRPFELPFKIPSRASESIWVLDSFAEDFISCLHLDRPAIVCEWMILWYQANEAHQNNCPATPWKTTQKHMYKCVIKLLLIVYILTNVKKLK